MDPSPSLATSSFPNPGVGSSHLQPRWCSSEKDNSPLRRMWVGTVSGICGVGAPAQHREPKWGTEAPAIVSDFTFLSPPRQSLYYSVNIVLAGISGWKYLVYLCVYCLLSLSSPLGFINPISYCINTLSPASKTVPGT